MKIFVGCGGTHSISKGFSISSERIECLVYGGCHMRAGTKKGHSPSVYLLHPTNEQMLTQCPWGLADPANVEGNAETAQVLGLTPWMDYQFRVLASNILGTGEPSGPSSRIRTKEAGQGLGHPKKSSQQGVTLGLYGDP
jgi:hypothetical protein